MRIPKYIYNLSEAEQAEWIAVKKEKQKVIRDRFEAKNPKYYTKYHAENREKRNSYNAKYNAKNREKRIAKQKKYYAENREKRIAQQKKYQTENREKKKSYNAKYRAEIRSEKSAIKFFQMTQAISEIANINTEKK